MQPVRARGAGRPWVYLHRKKGQLFKRRTTGRIARARGKLDVSISPPTLTDAEVLIGAYDAVVAQLNSTTDPDVARHLRRVRRGLLLRHRAAVDAEATPLVFDTQMPGSVTLGWADNPVTRDHPGLLGLDYAHQILLLGESAGAVLTAAQLVGPVGHPANALRNALRTAASWIERASGCYPLAQALRAPSISISTNGTIRAGNRPVVLLRA